MPLHPYIEMNSNHKLLDLSHVYYSLLMSLLFTSEISALLTESGANRTTIVTLNMPFVHCLSLSLTEVHFTLSYM